MSWKNIMGGYFCDADRNGGELLYALSKAVLVVLPQNKFGGQFRRCTNWENNA
jgi:hypothetical protein